MAMTADDDIATQRQQVQRLLGRCLPRLQQYGRLLKIVRALREAARELGRDGWTRVANAGYGIASRYPVQTPAHYRCRSWRQVLHESGLFDLRRRKIDGPRSAWYRERMDVSAPASCFNENKAASA